MILLKNNTDLSLDRVSREYHFEYRNKVPIVRWSVSILDCQLNPKHEHNSCVIYWTFWRACVVQINCGGIYQCKILSELRIFQIGVLKVFVWLFKIAFYSMTFYTERKYSNGSDFLFLLSLSPSLKNIYIVGNVC